MKRQRTMGEITESVFELLAFIAIGFFIIHWGPSVVTNFSSKLGLWKPETVAFHSRAQSLGISNDELTSRLCHTNSVCLKFSDARLSCATAGNFNNCVSVKMGDSDYALTGQCNNDGSMKFDKDLVPSELQCLFQ